MEAVTRLAAPWQLTGQIIGLAQQAQQPGRLDPVVVTATRTETPLSQTTRSVTVVTTEDSTAQGVQNVAEVLRNVSGLDVVRTGAMGGTTKADALSLCAQHQPYQGDRQEGCQTGGWRVMIRCDNFLNMD
jgi:outer membrane receptor protein involved in Fe transport